MSHDKNKFYVTTPIYYVTARPHLGSLYSTLLADVVARYHKISGQEVFFLTGTDEHGQKIAQAAQNVGMHPREFTDSFIDAYKSVWQKYELAYDYFIRTTDSNHIAAVQHWLKTLLDQGDIYKGSYEGWYCTPCETFVTEKDSKEVEAGQPLICSDCSRATVQVSESCYFFKLSAYQDRLLEFYEQNPNFITPKERMAEAVSFVKSGLKDLSISRSTISWGIPFPGDDAHVTYVWADALNNYITAVGYGDDARKDELAKWWPADLQILGKDIARFHAVYWPAFLMASGLAMPKKLLVHGWIKIGDQKMSKSLGNAVDPMQLAQDYGVDEIRYYLTRKMAITQDSEFKIEDIEQSINSELANAFGNLLNRMATLVIKNECQNLQAPLVWSDSSIKLQAQCQEITHEVWELIDQGMLHRAVGKIWDYINLVNAFLHELEPWKIVKHDKEKFIEIMSATAHSLQIIGILLWPVMPAKMELLLASLGCPFEPHRNYKQEMKTMSWKNSFIIQQIATLFTKSEIKKSDIVEIEKVAEVQNEIIDKKNEKNIENKSVVKANSPVQALAQEGDFIGIEDFIKLDLRIGTIIACENVQGSDKLLKSQVDFGDLGQRQVLSGIRKSYSAEQMVGKQALFVVNLKPRKMMGHDSQGMMLLALDELVGLKVMSPEQQVKPGTKVG
ncbi:methionine--tRNA ligase [Candidatus Babeliales bacterium]|nr:methionine--tRNA ligase [Candidatus Babeliales bacterium]MBP9843816.1 methionine--tRNA ligase [Candidatus Babeliales bacterium]